MCNLNSLQRIIFIIFFSFYFSSSVFAANWVPVKDYGLHYPTYLSGTYLKGLSNITEPKPIESENFEVLAGGTVIIEQGAGFFLNVKLRKRPNTKLYFKIEYPNPNNPNKPLINDMEFQEGMKECHFSSPEVIWGLKGYSDYTIKVDIFENKTAVKPIETLNQNVRSYVDTQTRDVLIFRKLLPSSAGTKPNLN